MIKREKYLEKIRPFVNKPIIKVISGLRRSGKSVLLKQIKDEIIESGIGSQQIIFINKELFEFDFIKNYRDLHNFITKEFDFNNQKQKYYIFIDEIQEIEQWERAIVSFLAEEKYDIYISGSNANMLSSELSTLLSGRYVEFQIQTLTYSEFIEIRKLRQSNSSTNVHNYFDDFLKYGGFPGIHNLSWDENIIRQYLQAVYNTIILKDIIMRNSIRDVAMLQRILSFLSENIGNITTAKNISDYIKSQNISISPNTVQNYIAYASSAFMFYQIKRFDLRGKRILEFHDKYFLSDIGLYYAQFGHQVDSISARLENVVMHEMLSRGYSVMIGKVGDNEVDFICEKNNNKVYIQVTLSLFSSNVVKREYRVFDTINDHFPKYVLSLDKGFDTDKKGIEWMNIEDFLLSDKF
jgi:predicted AAA+ superfamily ATPase